VGYTRGIDHHRWQVLTSLRCNRGKGVSGDPSRDVLTA
jgi:hypothetical protein